MAWKQKGERKRERERNQRVRERDARNFLSYEDELKSSWAMAGSEIGDEGRGVFLRGMKQVLYTADGERFREKVFIGRSSKIRYGSYLRHIRRLTRVTLAPRQGAWYPFIYGVIETQLWGNFTHFKWELPNAYHLNYFLQGNCIVHLSFVIFF